MAESVEGQILRSTLTIACPRCGYDVWVRYSEIVTQVAVRCPCCRVRIRLVDDAGSVATAGRQVDQAIEDMFKDFGEW
jgi:DNA-directed RNA polymerase subunit RPC12/RpoP